VIDKIQIRGARTHNLKNIDLDIPRNKLVVITGLSGSGKSSLAFDTLFAEGQRRYVESLSAYARQFLSIMEKPDMDHIEGLSPAISIEQKTTSHNPRSTVGTITEIYDYLRLLFARAGTPQCPQHHTALAAQTVSQMVDHVLQMPENTKLMLLAPVIQNRKGEHKELLEDLKRQGFIRARINGKTTELDDAPELEKNIKHRIEVVVDRFKARKDLGLRLAESFETALNLTDGIAHIAYMDDSHADIVFSSRFACTQCGYSLSELEPRLFSFNNPVGACAKCDGLGHVQHLDPQRVINNPTLSLPAGAIRGWDRRNTWYHGMLVSLQAHYGFNLDAPFEVLPEKIQHIILYGSAEEDIEFHVPDAKGKLKSHIHPFEGIIPSMQRRFEETQSSAVRDEMNKFFTDQTCPDCNGSRLNTGARHVFVSEHNLPQITHLCIIDCLDFFKSLQLEGSKGEIAEKIVKEIISRLQFLVNVGLNYLSLDRSSDTLSGGEAQRIRLASQIGAGLMGVMYILDEPSIGLHQRDNERLLQTLLHLRDLGNTVIVVEHDEDAILNADYVIDIGPGAGVHGGEIVACGTPAQVMANRRSLTGQYLSGHLEIKIPETRLKQDGRTLKISGASGNNLQQVCVTGVSGSGKSTLINDTLYKLLAREINKSSLIPAHYESCEGLEQFDKVVDIDQAPIGRTPRSNPATYTGLFTPLRELFAGTQEARSRGYKPGRFSFNVKGGRCEACQGDGVIKVEMHFLPDIYVPCDVCKSKRYNRETLDIKYKGKNINEVLQMTIEDALIFFSAVPTHKTGQGAFQTRYG